MKNEINHFESILEEKETYLISLKYEKKKLVDHYRKVADDQEKQFRVENLSLEKQMNKNKEDLLFVEKEMGELTRKKNDIENEVELKSNIIRKRDKEIVEKEREVWDAIEESNRLRLKLDTLQQQHSETMVEDKEMSKKIEILEDELVEKENAIMNLRKKNTMTREEIEEELGKITKGQEKKLDDQTAMIKQQNEKIDFLADTLMKVLKSQEKK
jgi:chromosome segregation ATPase